MVNLKRFFVLLLAAGMLIMAACSGERAENPAATNGAQNGNANAAAPAGTNGGRYVETDITPPIEGRFASFLAQDGTIVCYDAGLKNRYESADGGVTWTNTPGPGSSTDQYADIRTGTLLPDGSLLAYVEGEGLIQINPDGSNKPFPVADIDEALASGENIMLSLLQALDNDRIALSYTIGGMVMQTRREGPEGGEGSMPNAVPPTDAQGGSIMPNAAPPTGAQGGMPNAAPPAGAQGGMPGGTPSEGAQGGTIDRRGAMAGPMVSKTLLIDLASGAVVAELPVENASSAASNSENIYLMDASGTVTVYNLADGTPSGQPEIRFGGQNTDGRTFMSININGSGSLLSVGGEGSLYAAYEKNVLHADANGDVATTLESTAYSIGGPRSQINSLFALASGEIVVNLLDNGQENRLYKYIWDENAATDPNKTLSIWSLEDNNYVRAAITELRKTNPDAQITYEVAMEGDNAVSAADAIKTLNTRLLGGSGPDVILLDGCPVESYADKGMLLELDGLLDTGDVYENLLAPYTSDGKIYCLPTQFMMPAIMGSADALAQAGTLEELVALVVNGNGTTAQTPGAGITEIPEAERAALYFNDLRELCKVLWLASAPSIVSDNQLNTDALREYLTAAKAISDKYALTETPEGRMMLSAAIFDGGMATELPGSLVRYTSQMTNYGAFTAGNLQLLQMMMERAGSELTLFPGLTPGAWEPSTVVGINADTGVTQFAAEFLQTMLSLDVQQLSYGTGLPVTRAGIAAQVDAINERLAEDDLGTFTLDVNALIGQLQTPSMGDTALTDMMWTTVEKCCKGEIDIEGAVKEIEQNVKNYLAERS